MLVTNVIIRFQMLINMRLHHPMAPGTHEEELKEKHLAI